MRSMLCGCCSSPPRVDSAPEAAQTQQMERQNQGLEERAGPYVGVDDTLRAMAGSAEGFGRHTVGGLDGPVYHVTSLADEGEGTLRKACSQKNALWIVFDLSGTIGLASPIKVSSHKTIDGRGQRIKVTGKGLHLKECEHVIICNMEFEGGRGHDVDGIQIKPQTKNVWIDRCTLSDYDDGLIDITRCSTDITISRCHFHHHNKTMLISASPKHVDDRCIRVSIHHCFFDGTRQRHPRLRFGKVHLYNNFTRGWAIYAVCASVEAQILSQGCIYEAGTQKVAFEYYTEHAADQKEPSSGNIRSEGDIFLNDAQGHLRNPIEVFSPEDYYSTWTLETADNYLMEKVCMISGWQDVALPPDTTKKAHS